MKKKIHFDAPSRKTKDRGFLVPACGVDYHQAAISTTDKTDVNCKRCERTLKFRW